MHAPLAQSQAIRTTDYRPDIDGLRAVAVLSVMAFHYSAALPGGFTGVDVFFVISGFLITQQLVAEIGTGSFSILRFYDRRIRRILPALVVVLVATIWIGRFILLPGDYKALGASAAYATIGLSNLFFLHNTGYFDAAAELQPLLHTWSLAVEEQFYLVWPLLLLLLMKSRSRTAVAIVVGAAVLVGLVTSVVWLGVESKGAFYLAVPRAWELAVGALLVFLRPLSKRLGALAVISGLVLIAVGFAVVHKGHFPGAAALYPCVGAALVIWPRQAETAPGRWLGMRPFRAIGRISYSLYLWHWPVWVLYRHYINNTEPSTVEAICLALVSIALATLSFYFVEKPIRERRPQPTQTVRAGAFACLALFCSGVYIDSAEGLPKRLTPTAYPLRSLEVMWDWKCPQYEQLPQLNGSYCSFGHAWATAKTKALLWGDSHAGHFAPMVQLAAREDMGLLLYTNCPAALGGHVHRPFPGSPNYHEYCTDQRQRAIQLLQDDPSINLVVLAASWAHLTKLVSQDGQLGKMNGVELLASGIEDLIAKASISGRRFVLIGTVPQQRTDPIPCALVRLSTLLREPCAIDKTSLEWMQTFTVPTDRMLQDIARRHPNVTALIPRDALCDAADCKTYLDGEFLYRDGRHIRRNLKPETLRDLADLIGLPSALAH
ncbi:acyltransferase family protein [Bradyrhizobium retamae]|uniref:Acyltransferase n=1 Tax=Bradyrhizobium retamae TaxID=1300035 RepID=A0A0R3MDF6_9BRAD|nr:acyltransferase family protein [Bradyrhizobium retamae]KRR18137.1 hypothetical protein CQ13_35355 [Bradyrhizobium retamae]